MKHILPELTEFAYVFMVNNITNEYSKFTKLLNRLYGNTYKLFKYTIKMNIQSAEPSRKDYTVITAKAYFINDLLNGTYKEWTIGGSIFTEINFVIGKEHGVRKYYNEGQPLYEAHYVNDKKHGTEKIWDNNVLVKEEQYKDGLLCGITRCWHLNGKLKSEGNIEQGKVTEWYENGNIKSEDYYKNGNIDGLCKRWDEDGKLLLYKYVHGILAFITNG
jgi:antitoxin component YwqK of YwqJK toxin-antitoxin module